jgi:hypothetical protein
LKTTCSSAHVFPFSGNVLVKANMDVLVFSRAVNGVVFVLLFSFFIMGLGGVRKGV